VLRISRSRAYEEVAAFLRTGGAEGLPSIRIGRCLRVPKRALVAWIDAQLGGFVRREHRRLVIDPDRAAEVRAQVGSTGWLVLEAVAAAAPPERSWVEAPCSTRSLTSLVGCRRTRWPAPCGH